MKKFMKMLGVAFFVTILTTIAVSAFENTVFVGETYRLPEGPGNNNSYEHYANYTFSDESAVKVKEDNYKVYATFLKPGKLVVKTEWYYKESMYDRILQTGTFETVYNVNDTFSYSVGVRVPMPYNNTKMRQNANASVNRTIVTATVCYEMFGKQLPEDYVYKKGDNIGIVVYLTPAEGLKLSEKATVTLLDTGEASYKNELLEDGRLKCAFPYTVPAGDSPVVNTAHFIIDTPVHGEPLPKEAACISSDGIEVKRVAWSPDDEVADVSKEYTVSIYFDKQDKYVWSDTFGSDALISVNHEFTELMFDGSTASGRRMTQATFRPTYEISTSTVTDLEPPYHGSELAGTADAGEYLTVESVKYYMFKKEIDEVSVGDNIDIVVSVKTNDENITFAPGSVMYWEELDAYNTISVKVSDCEIKYHFVYTVPAGDAKTISGAEFLIDIPEEGEAFSDDVDCDTDGIIPLSVTITPDDEKAVGDETYTVKIVFGKEEKYLWADDFEEAGLVKINGKSAVLSRTREDKFYNYQAEADFKIKKTVKEETEDKKPEEKPVEYSFPFVDVPKTEWYFESVKSAHKMGLINGKYPTIYAPGDKMTFAEAVKLAVCMNILYNGGDPGREIANGTDEWYSTYMEYALSAGIIDEDLSYKADDFITRAEYVYIFSNSLPKSAFTAKNEIPTGSIPDVKNESTSTEKAIYLFYRAGILSGSDLIGTFNPSDNIIRSEVAAILIRMMDSSARVKAPTLLGK